MNFWKIWGSNILSYLDATANRVAIVASIIAFFGLQYSNVPYAWMVFVAFGIYLIFIIVISKPAYIPPPNLALPLDLEVVNAVLSDTRHVGILGLENSGKTTFLDATVSRPPKKQQTAKPYGQFVSIPDTIPQKSIVLLDSVGAREHVQFMIQASASNIVLMIDHNQSDTLPTSSPDRLQQHRDLADQLIHTATDTGVIIDKIVIAVNKSDLWQQDQQSVVAVEATAYDIQRKFEVASAYRKVILRSPYSNESRSDVASLLKDVS